MDDWDKKRKPSVTISNAPVELTEALVVEARIELEENGPVFYPLKTRYCGQQDQEQTPVPFSQWCVSAVVDFRHEGLKQVNLRLVSGARIGRPSYKFVYALDTAKDGASSGPSFHGFLLSTKRFLDFDENEPRNRVMEEERRIPVANDTESLD